MALVATKLCAWKGRGNGDLLRSLDVHDVLTLFDGRLELPGEIVAARPPLRAYIEEELAELRAEPYFDYAVDGMTASYGSLAAARAGVVRERLDLIYSVTAVAPKNGDPHGGPGSLGTSWDPREA